MQMKKILNILVISIFLSISLKISIDYIHYKKSYNLINEAFSDYDLDKIKKLEGMFHSISIKKEMIPNLWKDWYIERNKHILMHLRKYKELLLLLESIKNPNRGDLITICLIKDKLNISDSGCYKKILDSLEREIDSNNLEIWTVYIMIDRDFVRANINKISDETVYTIVNDMLKKTNKDILSELYPDN